MQPPVNVPVITLDGPSGSGKGTIGLKLAKLLGWHFLDSGALYRVLALAALKYSIPLESEAALLELAKKLNIKFEDAIFLDNEVVTEAIRQEACGNAASQIAVFPAVREALVDKQRAMRVSPGLVADGRDMGTVIFPDAVVKFFLEASPKDRAERRYLQLKDSGQNVTLEHLLADIMARDARDRTRAVAPLVPATDAVVIDTTGLGVEAVFARVLETVQKRLYQS